MKTPATALHLAFPIMFAALSLSASGFELRPPQATTNGAIRLDVTGAPTGSYVLETSGDLTSWASVDVTSITNGSSVFIASPPQRSGRYYRARLADADEIPSPLTFQGLYDGYSLDQNIFVADGQQGAEFNGDFVWIPPANPYPTYDVLIPPGAIAGSAMLSGAYMYQVSGLPGTALAPPLYLSPENAIFHKPITVVFKSRTQLPLGTMAYAWHAPSNELHLIPAFIQGDTATITLTDFEGCGLLAGTDTDRALVTSHLPKDRVDQFEHHLAIAGDSPDAKIDVLRKFFQRDLLPLARQAIEEDALVPKVVGEFQLWQLGVNSLVAPPGDLTAGSSQAAALITQGLVNAVERNLSPQLSHSIPALSSVVHAYQWLRIAPFNALTSTAQLSGYQTRLDSLLKFQLELDSSFHSDCTANGTVDFNGDVRVTATYPINAQFNSDGTLYWSKTSVPESVNANVGNSCTILDCTPPFFNCTGPYALAVANPTPGAGSLTGLAFNLAARRAVSELVAATSDQGDLPTMDLAIQAGQTIPDEHIGFYLTGYPLSPLIMEQSPAWYRLFNTSHPLHTSTYDHTIVLDGFISGTGDVLATKPAIAYDPTGGLVDKSQYILRHTGH